MLSRIIIWPHQHPIASSKKISYSPSDPRFSCWDLWKEQWKMTMAYAHRLYSAGPKRPIYISQVCLCLLAGSVLELQQVMKQYIPFLEDIVFSSVVLTEGFFGSKTPISTDALPAPCNVPPEAEATSVSRPTKESMPPWVPSEKQVKMEVPPNQFLGWEKVLHPSQLVAMVGQAPQTSGDITTGGQK